MHDVAYRKLAEKALEIGTALNLEVAPQDVGFPDNGLASKPDEYIEISVFPNTPSNRMVGKGRERYVGIFQLTYISKEMLGVEVRLKTARQIAAFYVKGMVFYGNEAGEKITVFKKPDIASPLRDKDEIRVPISIEYEFFA